MSQYYYEKITQNLVYPLHAFEATSPRKVLFAINFILALCMVVMATYSVYLTSLLFDPDFITGKIACCVIASCLSCRLF